MNPQQVQQIIDALNHAAGSAWQALVSQEEVSGFQGIAWCAIQIILGLTLAIVSVRFWRRARQAPQHNYEIPNYKGYGDGNLPLWTGWLYVFAGVTTIASITLLLTGSLLVVDAVGHVANPAGYAIKELLGK